MVRGACLSQRVTIRADPAIAGIHDASRRRVLVDRRWTMSPARDRNPLEGRYPQCIRALGDTVWLFEAEGQALGSMVDALP